MISLNGRWIMKIDPDNSGKDRGWFEPGNTPDGIEVNVPCTIQQNYPGYCGVAWYWRTFKPEPSPYSNGRYLLRFWAVDYLAEVWINGIYAGGHEGGETPFTLDVTECIRSGEENLLVVRVINPGNEPIDGIVLKQTPHRNKVVPYVTGGSYNHGGIMQSVKMICLSSVRIVDVFAKPDASTGSVNLKINIRNDSGSPSSAILSVSAAPASGGFTIASNSWRDDLPSGDSFKETSIQISEPNLWSLDDPYLYRAVVRLDMPGLADELSVRFGFRDFCFRDGYFHLNGKRIFLRSAHTGNHYPIGMQLPHDMELLRRDLYFAKAMGFNMVRFIAGVAIPSQLDFCDELGLMVYEESYAGWCLEDSPKMAERFDNSTSEMILRDRNHPCVTIWGLLNETPDGPVFRHAVSSLPLVRSLDDTRMVLLGSGRWDGKWNIGSISNPGSDRWECLLGAEDPEAPESQWGAGGYIANAGDAHSYPGIPLSADSISFFRKMGEGTKRVFLSEHGNGGEVDAVRVIRLYEQAGAREDLEDYLQYKSEADKFLKDWERFGMESMFRSPADFMMQTQRSQAEQRLLGLNAIRSNPNLCGYSITGLVDQGMTAEGLWTTFRELKPDMMESIRDGWSPLRWCLFIEPVHGYSGQTFRLETMLANEDVLLPGEYPIRIRIMGPCGKVLERSSILRVNNHDGLVLPVLSEDVVIDGPSGRYEIIADFEHGAAPAGGRTKFFVSDPSSFPSFDGIVTLWEEEERIGKWLSKNGIKYHNFDNQVQGREVILVGNLSDSQKESFHKIVDRISHGSTAIFLSPQAFKKGDNPVGLMPLEVKGEFRGSQGWAAGRDDFAKSHPIFDGLQANGLLDLTYYRDLIPGSTFNGQEPLGELVSGSFAVGSYQPGGYYSGTIMAIHQLGLGSFIINSLLIMDNLGKHPAADRLMINLLNYAGRD